MKFAKTSNLQKINYREDLIWWRGKMNFA